MTIIRDLNRLVPVLATIGGLAASQTSVAQVSPVAIAPATMPLIGSISDRFQSYNIEMLEVTGGKFWKPYKDIAKLPSNGGEAAGTAGESGTLSRRRNAGRGVSPLRCAVHG